MKVNAEATRWSRRYQAALRTYLKQGPQADLKAARRLGNAAVALGLQALDVARSHAQALPAAVLPGRSSGTGQGAIARARTFFAETIVPIEKTHGAAMKAGVRVRQLTRKLRQRRTESSAAIRSLKRSVLLRRGAEQALKKSGKQHTTLLSELRRLQQRLRNLTHTCLSTQEDERRRMSVQLHDEIAQALIAVGLRLLALRKASKTSAGALKKEIASTQRLVRESGKKINQFAHEFRIHHGT